MNLIKESNVLIVDSSLAKKEHKCDADILKDKTTCSKSKVVISSSMKELDKWLGTN